MSREDDDKFLAFVLENGLFNKYQLFDANVDEWDYYDLSDEVLERLESYIRDNKK